MNLPPSSAAKIRVIRRTAPAGDQLLHANPLIHRLLSVRGITDKAQLLCSLADLPRPDALPGVSEAVDRLFEAREANERIVVVGDYDCDGATSTSVALSGLKMLGFKQLDFVIPSRFKYGYGLSNPIVDLAIDKHAAQLIVTVDNGVASYEGIEHARERGVDVLVTDHHLPPENLPRAVAIVNPSLTGSTFTGRSLAGVGVVFYVLLALRARLFSINDDFGKAPLAQLLDLVAIGTIADLVPLDDVNRILVEQGLRRIRAGHSREGVRALLGVAGLQEHELTTEGVGFGIAPRLNAAGRLEDMSVGVRCLLSDQEQQAAELSRSLNALNEKRRSIEADMQLEADSQLANLHLDASSAQDAFGICLMDHSWHEGVIGILAGRVKERLHLPVVVFTQDQDASLKGSARSIAGVHIRDVLQSIAVTYPGMIVKFGGHAMAAGLTLRAEKFDTFKKAFDSTIRKLLNGRRPDREYLTDGSLHSTERTLENAQLLSSLMPWGQGFEAPIFDDHFIVRGFSVLKGRHLKLALDPGDTESAVRPAKALEAIAFNCTAEIARGDTVHLVYSLSVNHWRGNDTLQLRVLYLESAVMR